MTTPELPPLLACSRTPESGWKPITYYAESVEARERILMARIAELEADAGRAPGQPVAVPADNVTPLRQPRLDLARLADAITAAVYENAKGLSVTEAIGALELAKLELLKEQEQ